MVVATFDSTHPQGEIIAGPEPVASVDSNGSHPDQQGQQQQQQQEVSEGISNGKEKVKEGVNEAKKVGGEMKDKVQEGGREGGGNVPDLKIIDRVGNIPFVASGIETFENVVNSNQITAGLYSFGQGVAAKSLNIASPLIARAEPLLHKADGLANQGLDIAEDKFPYPFKTTTKDMANDSVAVFNDRVGPYMNNDIVHRAIEQIYALNNTLAATVVGAGNAVANATQSAGQHAHAITNQIVDQLYQLQTHGKGLPPKVYDSLSKSFEDVKGIVGDKEKNSQQKVNELVSYLQSIVQPALKEAGDYLTKTQSKGEKKAGDLSDRAQDLSSDAQKKAGDLADKAQDATADAQKQAKDTGSKAQDKAADLSEKAQDGGSAS